MNVVTRLIVLCTLLGGLSLPVWAQQTASVSGTVTDANDGLPLAGANLILLDEGGAQVTGAATNIDGTYRITGIAPGSYTLRTTFIGYQQTDLLLTLAAGEQRTVDVALQQGGFDLNTVVVTASRQAEKVLDAPASISVLSPKELQEVVAPSSIEALRNTTGVDMAQTGVDRREVVLRGFNNAFSGATYVLTDYRQAAVPSLGVNIYSIMPNMTTDLERVEVVRGPGSALYGAGVDAGVIHFLTKDPFTAPGTTVSVAGGTRSTLAVQGRHAGTLGDKFGYKVTGAYTQADDWELDPNDPVDAAQLQSDFTYETQEAALASGFDVREVQDPDNPGDTDYRLRRTYDYEKVNINGLLQYRPIDGVTLSLNGGYSALTATVLSGIGTLQADGFGYTYGQARLQLDDVLGGNLFTQFYFNRNDAGDSYVYGSALRVVDNGVLYNGQIQYDMATWGDRQRFIVGADLELTRPDTEGLILGRNEDNDEINEYGAYVQSTTLASDQLDVTLALRADYNNIVDQIQFSPRAAFVYKAAAGHNLRLTYNRAFSSPGTNSNFLDIVAGQVPGTDILVRGRGSARGFTFPRDPNFEPIAGTDLVASSLNPSALGFPTPAGLPLDATYGAVYAGIAATPIPVLTQILRDSGIPVDDATTAALVTLLDPELTPVQGFSPGELRIANLSAPEGSDFDTRFELVQDLENIAPLDQTISQTIEAGYKGVFKNRVLFAVDAYYTNKKDFVGPLLLETPFVFVPNLSGDLTGAIAAGIGENPTLAGALGGLGVSPEQAAAIITGIAQAGATFPDKPGQEQDLPVAIVQAIENAPGAGRTPELMLAYRNFGDVDYWGVDISTEVTATEQLTLFGNVSFVSDDFFDAEELGEENEELALALNAPQFKGKAGFSYSFPMGLSVNASGRYVDSFPVSSGPYQGMVDSYFLLDAGAGYDFHDVAPGLRLDVTVQNVLNNEHREFVGAPELGRFAMARLTYSL